MLNSPKGWTGPKTIDGKQVEGNFRSHQVPLAVDATCPDNVAVLETWLKSYKPEELFDGSGALLPELAALAPTGERRMGANPHANGGSFLRELDLPDFRNYAVPVKQRSLANEGNVHALGPYLRDVIKQNQARHNFRIFGPDELVSNRLEAVFERPIGSGKRVHDRLTSFSQPKARSLTQCSANTRPRAGLKATCSPEARTIP